MSYTEITKCRAGGGSNLIHILSLGQQALTGVFPRPADAVGGGPLDLVWCPDSGLVQLKQTYDKELMYGDNYGYRSGLNGSMVRHLQEKAAMLSRLVGLSAGEVVVDIGSNDATLLRAYAHGCRIGIDPCGIKFGSYYPADITLRPEFFSAEGFRAEVGEARAKIVTAIAMFYDLDDPIGFARDVESILAHDGVFHLEMSYLPAMLRTGSYDTVCHEHLEFYSLYVMDLILSAAGLRIIDVQTNSINGGSFAVTACKDGAHYEGNESVIEWMLMEEELLGLDTPAPYRQFEEQAYLHRNRLVSLVQRLRADGKTIVGYGASTKGNVLLQFCDFTSDDLTCIADVNPDKFGCVTPGTDIPIVSEETAKTMEPDYMLVLPWHFRHGILEREKEYRAAGGKLIFPLPEIEIV